MFRSLVRLAAGLSLLIANAALAQGFEAQVAPPRFEETAQPGSILRNVLEITNGSTRSARFLIKTSDWQLVPDGSVQFSDALAPGSCRPWVGIEAPEIQVAPSGRRRYRFEVAVPPDAPDGQCRFAIMIEGEPQLQPDGSLQVTGRIGIIVYLTIGKGAPVLSYLGTRVDAVQGRDLPLISIRNAGNAHARLTGFLEAIDANGAKVTMTPSSDPILPGTIRDIALIPIGDGPNAPEPKLSFPLRLKGTLESPPLRLDLDDQASK